MSRSDDKIQEDAQLREIVKNADSRNKLFLEVFDNDAGRLVLSYLEQGMRPRAAFGETDKTYYNLGRYEVVMDIKKRVKLALRPVKQPKEKEETKTSTKTTTKKGK